jgi:hypothetical protein
MTFTLPGPSLPLPSLAYRTRKAVVSWVGLLVMALNLMVGFAPQAAVLPELAHDELAICTSAGIVIIDEDGQSSRAEIRDGISCVFCLPLLHGSLLTPPEVGISAPVRQEAVVLVSDKVVSRTARPDFVGVPRAPPAA